MHLSNLAMSVGQSATLRLNELANNLKSEGKDIIHLGGGEPEADIPGGAYEKAVEKLKTRRVRYTPTSGIKTLKEKIRSYTRDNYGVEPALQNIVVSSGAKQSIYNFLTAVVNPGDQVVFPAPYWVSYTEMVKLVHGQPVVVKPAKGLLCDIGDLESHITSNTRAVMLNTPNNPSGLMYGEDFIKKLVGICEYRGIYLMMDDIYNKLVFDGVKCPSAFEYSQKSLDESVIVSINGVSKTFSMTGFRIGWSVASQAVTQAMTRIQAQITSCPSELSQEAAVGALEEGDSFTRKMVEDLQGKRDVMAEELGKFKKVRFEKPQGTFYGFPDFSEYEKDSVKLSGRILEKTGVVTVPGKEFGLEGHLRISYCGKKQDIVEGVKRIRKLLDE